MSAPWIDPEEVAAKARAVVRASGVLRACDDAALARALGAAAACLADVRDPLGARLHKVLCAQSGLSPEGVRWGLEATLGAVSEASLRALPARPEAPIPLLTVMLAGNLFASALAAIVLPLWARVPVLAKASSRGGDALPRFFKQALARHDAELARCLEVTTFGHGHDSALRVLLSTSETLSVYGSDATLEAVRARLRAGTRLLAHGHGLGLAYVPQRALASEAAVVATAQALALDVAAYDQHGCLSPHAVLVEPGGACEPARFAGALHEALARRERELPRGALDASAQAEQLQWRGVARARGVLHAADAHAVSYEAGEPLRASCGFRHVGVYDCAGVDGLGARLAPLGARLKAVGYAGDAGSVAALHAALPEGHGAWLAPLGAMQRPALAARLENRDVFEGLAR